MICVHSRLRPVLTRFLWLTAIRTEDGWPTGPPMILALRHCFRNFFCWCMVNLYELLLSRGLCGTLLKLTSWSTLVTSAGLVFVFYLTLTRSTSISQYLWTKRDAWCIMFLSASHLVRTLSLGMSTGDMYQHCLRFFPEGLWRQPLVTQLAYFHTGRFEKLGWIVYLLGDEAFFSGIRYKNVRSVLFCVPPVRNNRERPHHDPSATRT